VARGHGRERTFQRDLTEPEQVDEAIRQLVGEVLADVARKGRPAVRLTPKVRYALFFTKTFSRTLPEPTTDAAVILAGALTLVTKRQPGRAIRLLRLRVEMMIPEPDPAERNPDR
jgi:DNA polymerase IV